MARPNPPSDGAPFVVALVAAHDPDPGARALAAVDAGAAAVEIVAVAGRGGDLAVAVGAVRAAVSVPIGVAGADGAVLDAALVAGATQGRVDVASGASRSALRSLRAHGSTAVLALEPGDPAGDAATRTAVASGLTTDRLAFDPGPLDPNEPGLLASRLGAIAALRAAGRRAVASADADDRHAVATITALALARGAACVRSWHVAPAARAATVTAAIRGAR